MVTHIRRARPEEADLLTEIAHAAKRHWGYPERWIRRWSEALTFTPGYIRRLPVYVACVGEHPIGCYALAVDGPTATLEHLWVRPQYIGRGIGRRLFEHAARTGVALGAGTLQIDSDPYAEAFYLRMGAERVGDVPADMEEVRRVLPRLVLGPERLSRFLQGPGDGENGGDAMDSQDS